MKKWFLVFCLLVLSACGTEASKSETISGQSVISEAKAQETAMTVIKEFWQAYEEIGAQASPGTKRERLMPFMTENMFTQAFQKPGRPSFPVLPVHTFGRHITAATSDSFQIVHILAARTEEESAVKQTVEFVKQEGHFVINSYEQEDTALSLTLEEAEAFLLEHGYEAVFLKEGPFDAFSTRIEDAYIFRDDKDTRIHFVISRKTGFFMIGIIQNAMEDGADPEGDAAAEQVRAKYAYLFTYRLAEMETAALSAKQQDIYNRYIIQPIEQAVDIDFDPALTDDERNRKTKELMDQSIAGMLGEIEQTVNKEVFSALQKDYAKWTEARGQYAEEMAKTAKAGQANHYYAAYKEATEDYLAYLFYEYLY